MPSARSQFKELGVMQVGPGGIRSPLNLPATQGYDIYPQERPRQPQQLHLMPHELVDPRNYMSPRYMAEGPWPGEQTLGMSGYPAPQRLIRARNPVHQKLPPDYDYDAQPQRLVRAGPPAHHQIPPDSNYGAMPVQHYADPQHGYESECSEDSSPPRAGPVQDTAGFCAHQVLLCFTLRSEGSPTESF